MSDTIRQRRRRTSSNFNEGALEIDSTFSDDPPRVRRRRTASNDLSESLPEDDVSLTSQDVNSVSESVNDNFVLEEHQIITPSLINAIDSIKAELREESRYDSTSEFWSDSHDWGNAQSSDYWHFLGSFE
jgi:hypothetical protein